MPSRLHKIRGKPFLFRQYRKHELFQYNCDLKYSPSGDGGVTWNEPFPVKTTSNPAEVLPSGIEQVYEGFPITLNWNYSLASGLTLGVVEFNSAGIVSIRADSSAGPVNALFFRTGVVLARLLKELFC